MMPSRGTWWRSIRAYATAVDQSVLAKTGSPQAQPAFVDAHNGTRVSPSLLDSFGRGHDYLRISLTERCNLRCTYCMPAEGVELTPGEDLLTNDEIVRLARLFILLGVSKVRLTGGEPTVRKDLRGLVERLGSSGHLRSLGMTSNGITLARKLPDLVKAGLTSVNLSLDTLDPLQFELMTRRRGHAAVLKSLDTALSLLPPSGHEPSPGVHLTSVKLNVVVLKGVNDREVLDFARLAQDRRVDVRFIEYMPFDDNAWTAQKLIPSSELLARLRSANPDLMPRSGQVSDTARAFSAPGWQGSVAFISSMTNHFCAGCSRLRLNADGGFKTCLFGPPKLNFRPLLRDGVSDADLLPLIERAIKGKKFAHNGNASGLAGSAKRVFVHYMSRTGGQRVALGGPGATGTSIRAMSTLTHVDAASGRPKMVDVGDKPLTSRTATATGSVWVNTEAFEVLTSARQSSKGDVFTVAQLAGIMSAKNASTLIPLCHPLILDHIHVHLQLDEDQRRVVIHATVACHGKTGVEMEALTAVSAACLTVWDMLKAVAGKDMRIGDMMVMEKRGGRSGDWKRSM